MYIVYLSSKQVDRLNATAPAPPTAQHMYLNGKYYENLSVLPYPAIYSRNIVNILYMLVSSL